MSKLGALYRHGNGFNQCRLKRRGFLWLLLKTTPRESVSKKGVLDAQGKLSHSLDVHVK
jgi:hypothetical protein